MKYRDQIKIERKEERKTRVGETSNSRMHTAPIFYLPVSVILLMLRSDVTPLKFT